MKKLLLKDYEEIKLWMYRNARQIELALWQYYFENGSREAVLSALSFYQNEDGGFGNTLEADNWNPNSSPITTLTAINILKGIDFTDIQHPIMRGIFKFLESNNYCSENGWYFTIPSTDHYPHAPWWTYNMAENEVEFVGVTAGIVSFILTNGDKNSEIFDRALSFSDSIIDKLNINEKFGETGVGGYCALLEAIEKSGLISRYDYKAITEKIKKLVHTSIEGDTSKWVYYNRRPSDLIHSPESIFYKDNEDIVTKELDYLIDTRLQNGVWNITWKWYDNYERFAKEFAISENWWKASKAIEKVNFLKNFNRLDI